jgi:hypothetical protein
MDPGTLHQHRITDCRSVVPEERDDQHLPDQHGTYKPELLAGLYLLLGGKCMEMRVQGLGVYAELLADTELQKVGERNWLGKDNQEPRRSAWVFGPLSYLTMHSILHASRE